MLYADTRKHETQVLSDFGNGGDSRFASALGDALFNCNGRRDAVQLINVGARHLLNELTRIGRHRFHEAALPLGKDNIKGERGFSGS